ncbi:hypothetical protein [Actinophytocola sp. NPDC049390]|uniref:hypothetical protein n=1 Tax=Actinophytocola sp. NPDC049390 TaxID=3363894 RepID=UPI0037932AEC
MDLSNLTPEQLATIQAVLTAQPQAPTNAGVAANVTPAAPTAEPAPTVEVSVGDVLGSSAYGPALFAKEDPIGTSFTGVVAQPTRAVQLRDFTTKAPLFFDDGRPKPQLIIGLDVPVSERHPEGRATWYAKGKDIPEINKAMTAAGVPTEVIKQGLEVGATITVTYARDQKNPRYPNANPSKIREVVYVRPGTTPPPAAPTAPAQPAAPVTPAPAVAQAPAANAPSPEVAALLAQLQAGQTPAA